MGRLTHGQEEFWGYCREVFGAGWDQLTKDEAEYARIRSDRLFSYELASEFR